MGTVLKLPMSKLQRLALLWQEEERAFGTVLEVLKSSRRFDLVLKVDTFNKVRRRRIMNLLVAELREQRRKDEDRGRGRPARGRKRSDLAEDAREPD